MAVRGTLRAGILLLPHFSFAELGLLLEPLFIANWLLQRRAFDWDLLGVEGTAIPAGNGIAVPVADTFPEAEQYDAIFVLASFETKMYAGDRKAKVWLRRAANAGVTLCGVQTGTEVLAAAGLMNGYRAAVHWDNLEGFQELYPEVEACADLFVAESPRMSCAGGTATLDLMLHWLAPRLDETVWEQVRLHMLEPRLRSAESGRDEAAVDHEATAHPKVRRALAIMRRNLDAPLSTAELAGRVGLSVRHLERRFAAELGTTPARYYRRLRMMRAHRLLQQTDLPVGEVAVASGFQSLEHFSRVYRRYFGCAPSSDRLQSLRAPARPR